MKNNPSQGFNGKQSTAKKPVCLNPTQTNIGSDDNGKKNNNKPSKNPAIGFLTNGKAT